jgi:hypothetical protein
VASTLEGGCLQIPEGMFMFMFMFMYKAKKKPVKGGSGVGQILPGIG